jgi:hypothetical protein
MQRDDVQDYPRSGLAARPALQWGSHTGHLFDAPNELHEVLVPYFKAGLEVPYAGSPCSNMNDAVGRLLAARSPRSFPAATADLNN